MARSIQSPLRTRTSRLKLAARKKPYFALVAPGVHLGYRANEDRATSSWSVRTQGWLKRLALADDMQDSDGKAVLTFFEAQQAALKLARGSDDTSGRPVTVREALGAYEADLSRRGGSKYNAQSARNHCSPTLLNKTVLALTEADLSNWRDGLMDDHEVAVENGSEIADGVKLSSANRIGKSLKAALALAAKHDRRITNAHAWVHGLKPKKLKGIKTAPRENFYLPDATINAIVTACYAEDADFGALIHTLAVTGQRESQLLKTYPADLITKDAEGNDVPPRLLIWCSEKGKDRTPEQRSVRITASLAQTLRERSLKRGRNEPLFDKLWNVSLRFRTVLVALGLDETLTPYVLRHSSIIRQIRGNKPARIIAHDHDTSLTELEKTYARYLEEAKADFAEIGLLADDVIPSNVVPLHDAA